MVKGRIFSFFNEISESNGLAYNNNNYNNIDNNNYNKIDNNNNNNNTLV